MQMIKTTINIDKLLPSTVLGYQINQEEQNIDKI